MKVATPLVAATVVAPERVALPGFAPSATVTFPVKLWAVFPSASSADTWTAGVIGVPEVAFDGSTVKATWLAAPAETVNTVLVAIGGPVAPGVSVEAAGARAMLRPRKGVPPATAVPVI